MKRQKKQKPEKSRRPGRGANLLAGLVACSALGFLYLSFDPTVAGADPDSYAAQSAADVAIPTATVFDEPAPAPTGGATTVVTADATSTTHVPLAPRDDRQFNTLVGLLLDGEDVNLPIDEESTWDDNRLRILTSIVLLRRGLEHITSVPDYSVTFFKQERIDGTLLDSQVVRMKIQHQPFSVYMKWITGDKGRELLYTDGKEDGKLLVHAGGWKARLVPALKLDPNGSLAMRESRHPCTMAGIANMLRKMLRDRQHDLAHSEKVRYRMVPGEMFDDRPCYAFLYEHEDREHSPEYRKCIVYLDEETCLPVFCKNYGWPHEQAEIAPEELDEATLIEHYHFTELDTTTRLAEADFDRDNRKYRFKR